MSDPVRATRGIGTVSTVDALMFALRERILSGEIPSSSPLREAELCAQYNVSRHSLRTALRGLLASGLLTHHANHGVFVSSLGENDVHDIYALRRSLELEAIDHLASNPERQKIVAEALERLENPPADATWAEVRELDLRFHLSVVESMGRPRTTRVFMGLIDELALAFLQLKHELEVGETVGRQHRKIFDAAVTGSGRKARVLLANHLDSAESTICAAFATDATVSASTT